MQTHTPSNSFPRCTSFDTRLLLFIPIHCIALTRDHTINVSSLFIPKHKFSSHFLPNGSEHCTPPPTETCPTGFCSCKSKCCHKGPRKDLLLQPQWLRKSRGSASTTHTPAVVSGSTQALSAESSQRKGEMGQNRGNSPETATRETALRRWEQAQGSTTWHRAGTGPELPCTEQGTSCYHRWGARCVWNHQRSSAALLETIL